MNIKEIKSVELSSFTTMITGISIIFSIISTIIIAAALMIFVPTSSSLILYLIPTIIVGTFMYTIYNSFCEGLLYNILSKKLKTIAIALEDGKIVKISTTETAMMVSIILTIQVILLYLVSVLVLPIFLSSIMQTMMLAGQQMIAYSIYQLVMLLSQPTTIIMIIFGVFIITFVFTLLGTYIYNFIAKSGRCVEVNLSEENRLTQINSINSLKLGIAFGIICGVLGIILGVISIVSGGNATRLIIDIIMGFIGGFVEAYLFAVFYNFLVGKLGKIKLELIDYKIN